MSGRPGGGLQGKTHMQKINANNWISAARSCAPNSAPCQSATLAAFEQRRSSQPGERAPLSR